MREGILEDFRELAKDVMRARKPLPEAPQGYFCYHGAYGIPFAENGRVKACWIQESKIEGGGRLPGFWLIVGTQKKVLMDGTLSELSPMEKVQWCKADI